MTNTKEWQIWTLSRLDIIGLSGERSLPLNVDYDEVARKFKKKIEAAVEDVWEDALEESVVETYREKEEE